MLFLLVTSLVVPESSGLSSSVRDSWESTHPCTDHFDSNEKKLKEYPIVVGAQVGKLVGHSICLRVWNGGLRGRCLDGV